MKQFLNLNNDATWHSAFAINALIYLAVSFFIPKLTFENGLCAGFFLQLSPFFPEGNVEVSDTEFRHYIRYLSVFPALWFEKLSMPYVTNIIIFALLTPVIYATRQHALGWISFALPYMALFVSLRITLCAISLAYLFLLISSKEKRFYWLYPLSLFFTNLSSGVLLFWGAQSLFYAKTLIKTPPLNLAIYLITLACSALLLFSYIQNKLTVFNFYQTANTKTTVISPHLSSQVIECNKHHEKLEDNYSQTKASVFEGMFRMVERSIVIQLFQQPLTITNALHAIIILALIVCWLHSIITKNSMWMIFTIAVGLLLFEGPVSVACYIIITLYFIQTNALGIWTILQQRHRSKSS